MGPGARAASQRTLTTDRLTLADLRSTSTEGSKEKICSRRNGGVGCGEGAGGDSICGAGLSGTACSAGGGWTGCACPLGSFTFDPLPPFASLPFCLVGARCAADLVFAMAIDSLSVSRPAACRGRG